jgi:hypothetical protein
MLTMATIINPKHVSNSYLCKMSIFKLNIEIDKVP